MTYIVIRDLPDSFSGAPMFEKLFDIINIRAGAFDIDFGDQQYRRSNNASVQRNLLIGNYVVDPSSEEIGVEIFSDPGRFFWLLGFTSGTTTGDFKEGRGIGAFHSKVGVNVFDSLRLSTSLYRVDHSDNAPKPTGTGSSLFAGNRSGGPYGGVFDDGQGPGEVFPGKGQDVTAIQGDATWHWNKLELYGHYGWFEDADVNGSGTREITERWRYYAIEAAYYLTEKFYLASRFSGASADKLNDLSSDGYVYRIQLGGGYWLMNDLLLKAEYVNEQFEDFAAAEGPVAGVNAWNDPSFDGIITEVSYSF